MQRVKEMLREWSMSNEARALLLKQWRDVEDQIMAEVFDDANVALVRHQIVERVTRSLIGQATHRGKQLARKAMDPGDREQP